MAHGSPVSGGGSAVPAANDNLSSVAALLAIGDALSREPLQRLRVILLSAGSEESFLEGMVRFAQRHFRSMSRGSVTFLCLESIGSPQLMLLSGEGLLRLRRYPPALIERLSRLAVQNGVSLREPFAYRLATDGQIPLRAGFPTAVISSMDWYKAPSDYHWPSDRPENLQRESVCAAAGLALAFSRDLAGPLRPVSIGALRVPLVQWVSSNLSGASCGLASASPRKSSTRSPSATSGSPPQS